MKKLLSLFVLLAFIVFPFQADSTRSIYKNRTLPPHFIESAVTFPDLQTFTATGTWYRPPGIEYVIAIIAGSGGGGYGGVDAANGGGGGSGGEVSFSIVDVRGTSSETVTIGAVGTGGAYQAEGTSGGASSFGALATAAGGLKGTGSLAPGESAGVGSGRGGNGSTDGLDGSAGFSGLGGSGDADSSGGGGGSYGVGGDTGSAATANTGGGGAGGIKASGAGQNGGTGIGVIIPLPRNFTLP